MTFCQTIGRVDLSITADAKVACICRTEERCWFFVIFRTEFTEAKHIERRREQLKIVDPI